MIASILWAVCWFLALAMSLSLVSVIVHDKPFENNEQLFVFFATPALWAIIAVFFF